MAADITFSATVKNKVQATMQLKNTLNAPAQDVTIYKSNGTTVVAVVNAPGSYTTPAVSITDNLAIPSGISKEAGESYTCVPLSSASCQQLNGQLTQAQRQVINRINTLKTGQTTSYAANDDGELEKGRLVDFFTLSCNNAFGNTNRFTDENGTQNYNNQYMIDHATGLGWKISAQAAAVWDTHITNAANLIHAGFTGWRLPNMNEIISVTNYETTYPLGYTPFNLLSLASRALSSTTQKGATTSCIALNINIGASSNHLTVAIGKTSSQQAYFCRNHY